ncbi:hypothetical protein PS880_05514 [Pseudomonas fluorescens]|uniref:Uncharacterized protein n=1 Tax=Pseudomonas fluorescens TaxID=294 RepID=A0A5E7Q3G0_PSEFL|nr:hypothetical protein PS880_05514 [Pseudomonas fluorescens]
MDHAGADGKRHHHNDKVAAMFIGKPQHRSGFAPFQKTAQASAIPKFTQ